MIKFSAAQSSLPALSSSSSKTYLTKGIICREASVNKFRFTLQLEIFSPQPKQMTAISYRVRAKRHVKSFLLLRNPTFHLHKYVLLDRPDPFIFQGALKRVGDARLLVCMYVYMSAKNSGLSIVGL